MGQRGPACLASVQRADGLIPQPHRTGRGTERGGRKGGASGTSHLSHAGSCHNEKIKARPTPRTNHKHTGRNEKIKMMSKGKVNTSKKEGAEKENRGMKQKKSFFSRSSDR